MGGHGEVRNVGGAGYDVDDARVQDVSSVEVLDMPAEEYLCGGTYGPWRDTHGTHAWVKVGGTAGLANNGRACYGRDTAYLAEHFN